MQNSQARGVEGTLTEGPVSATVEFGDGVDSGVFNTVQALVSYTVNSSQTLDVYGMANVGKTGPYTFAYGGGQTGLGSSYANSDMIGAFYVYSAGSLSLVPEVQYQYAKQDVSIGIMGPASNLGLALFGDYSFGTSPYSVGGWLEYYTSHTSAAADTSGIYLGWGFRSRRKAGR